MKRSLKQSQWEAKKASVQKVRQKENRNPRKKGGQQREGPKKVKGAATRKNGKETVQKQAKNGTYDLKT